MVDDGIDRAMTEAAPLQTLPEDPLESSPEGTHTQPTEKIAEPIILQIQAADADAAEPQSQTVRGATPPLLLLLSPCF